MSSVTVTGAAHGRAHALALNDLDPDAPGPVVRDPLSHAPAPAAGHGG